MSESLNRFRQELSEAVLGFVWQQWSSIGVMAAGAAERTRVIDPEPLLLLTLEVARQDPRMFDEVLDWVIVNGKWINIGRLSALLSEDKVCTPAVLGAVAATLARYDKTPKWRTLAKALKPKTAKEPESLFLKGGRSLFLTGAEADATFRSYGLLRSPVTTRGMAAPVIPSPDRSWTAANFVFKARALFGVNIRADVFAFLVLQGAANPTRIARELGFSQRRVQDALTDMAAADVFQVRTAGNSKEYSVNSESVLRFLGATESEVAWSDWRALGRALATIWRRAFALREAGLTPYVLESEQEKVLREVKNDLLGAVPRRKTDARPGPTGSAKTTGLMPSLQNALGSSSGYKWKRFWVPRDGVINYADGGYPVVPNQDQHWSNLIQTDAVDFDAIAHVRCLVLLGEPGMGKSFTLESAVHALEGSLRETGAKLLRLDLKSYGSEDRLIRDLFESETFRGWVRGEYQLHIFLDSLDEALLHQRTIANLLVDKLKDLPSVGNLYFRIACRTAEWPKVLEEGLRSKWSENDVQVYELVPLTRGNVEEAAKACALETEDFMREVDRCEVVPLAFKPITLKFLLGTFQQKGCFSSSQMNLYAEGCRILCEETNQTRIGAKLAGKLTTEQRMEIAAHLAAASVFCNRSAIWTGPNTGLVPDTDLTLDELCGGAVLENGLPVTREAITEALATALFSSRGSDRLGWAHQTHAEFLAAWHLHRRGMSQAQIFSLLFQPSDSERRLIPQLHETAAWLASMDAQVFRALMKSDPEVLLRSDVATASPDDQEKLVASLLSQFEEGILSADWSLTDRYRKLAHSRLAEQLRPCLLDPSKNPIVRCEAIRIARACAIRTLAPDLALVALDSTEDPSIRAEAAAFVADVGEPTLRARLKPLLNLPAEQDPTDELKGYALKACWPDSMSAEELFDALTPPKRQRYIGAYSLFFSKKLVESLRPADLLVALAWMRRQEPRHELRGFYREMMENILERAALSLESPGVLQEFAKTILHRLRKNDELIGRCHDGWRDILASNDILRRRIVETFLPEMVDTQRDAFAITCCGFLLAANADVLWLVERLEREPDPKTQAALAHLIKYAFRITAASADAVIRASETSQLLRELFSYHLTPMSLNSEEARQACEENKKQKSLEAQMAAHSETQLLTPPPGERITVLLDKFETQGQLDAFWRLLTEMTLEPTSTHYEREEEADVTQLPGWVSADAGLRIRIVAAALRYLYERGADPDAWFWKENFLYRPALAGFKALCLLHKEAPEAFAQLPRRVWTNWMSVIVHEARYDNGESGILASAAYRAAPDEMIQWLGCVIDRENDRSGNMTVFWHLENVWDDRLARALLEKAATPGLKPTILLPILEILLAHGVAEVKEHIQALITLPLPADDQLRQQSVDAAKALLLHTQDGWSVIWPAMLQDPAFGRCLFEDLAAQYFRAAGCVVHKLTDEHIADLYVWLVGQFPPADVPDEMDAHVITLREKVGDFRNGLIAHLGDRGTLEACEAIDRLLRQFPSFQRLKGILAQAKAATRKKTWQPPSPRDLFKLLAANDRRLVRDGDELLALVVESLDRLEKRMQGATPASEFLWDKVPGTKLYRPKDENAFANFVKLHLESELQSRGIVINREVEIRRGEETDIHIDAVTNAGDKGFDRVTVIIETKGSWNRDLETAIESQLVNRYLRDNACQHGLYLVGCFDCPKWDNDDYRKKASSSGETAEVRQRLYASAAELSKSGSKVRVSMLNATLR